MVNKIKIATNAAPPATGTYSQAIRTGDLVFVTAQTGRDPGTGDSCGCGSGAGPSTDFTASGELVELLASLDGHLDR